MSETKGKYKFDLRLSIGFPTAVRKGTVNVSEMGYEEDEWDAISDEQREAELSDYLSEWANNFIDANWS